MPGAVGLSRVGFNNTMAGQGKRRLIIGDGKEGKWNFQDMQLLDITS